MGKIAILGASGKLGGRLAYEALSQEHSVHAVSRDPSKLRVANERFTAIKGDLETGEGLERAVAGCRWIVSAVTTGQPSACLAHLLKAVGTRWVDRVVFVLRSDDLAPPQGLAQRFNPLAHRRNLAGDVASALDLLRVSGLSYLVLKCSGLTDDVGGKEVACAELHHAPLGPVSRVDLARFIIRGLEDHAWDMRELQVGTRH